MHKIPKDLKGVLDENLEVLRIWKNITALARNEWICFIESAKKIETRNSRIERLCNDLKNGKKRPCCWQGCQHRKV
jgi:uncharacterized protein YdeI (YjbR/CyaY-like superfamily)